MFTDLKKKALAVLCATLSVTASTSQESSEPNRWMFAAKFDSEVNLEEKVAAMEQVILACNQYEQAGFGYAVERSSSDYDLLFYVDSMSADVTNKQAACMVGMLANDTLIKNKLLSNLVDAAEISIPLGDAGNEESGDIVQAGFYNFRPVKKRHVYSEQMNSFTRRALGFLAPGNSSNATTSASPFRATQFAPTNFPDAYLKEWAQDAHYATLFNLQVGSNPARYDSLYKFWAHISSPKVANETGNFFVAPQKRPFKQTKPRFILCSVARFAIH